MERACCFIEHRKIDEQESVYQKVKVVLKELIEEKSVRTFFFGSKSEFGDICHTVVTEFQHNYPDIVRINYNRKSEYVVKKKEREELEQGLGRLLKKDVTLKAFEGAKLFDRVYNLGKRPILSAIKR